MRKLFLLRGLPGSGKTTLGLELKEAFGKIYSDVVLTSADDFMVDENGDYQFDPKKLAFAHSSCVSVVKNSMALHVPVIIVANTLTRDFELDPYIFLAKNHSYDVTSLVVENRHGRNSIHDVPLNTMEAMQKRFQVKLR